MSDEEASKYPHSAISTWSGFVYQGKVALYHCLKLINQGDSDFQLQLDSTDDFAIYKGSKLIRFCRINGDELAQLTLPVFQAARR